MAISTMREENVPSEVELLEDEPNEPLLQMIDPEDANEEDSVPTDDIDIPGEDEDIDTSESTTDGVDIAEDE